MALIARSRGLQRFSAYTAVLLTLVLRTDIVHPLNAGQQRYMNRKRQPDHARATNDPINL